MKKRWVIILQIAATYIGTVVGTGFASGKEIVEFFTVHGPMGMIGILVSGILFIWIGTKMMVLSHRIGAYFRKEELQVSWKLFVSPFAYVAFNLAMAQAVLVPLGKEIEDESVLKWGGFWGGAGLCFMLLSCHFALYSLPNVSQFDIPIAEVIKSFGKSIHILFLIVVYGEIFTTLIGNVFGISRKMQKFFTLSERRIVLGILLLSFLISQVGFSSLLSFLYPLFGYIGLLMIFFVTLKQLPAK